MMQMNMISPIAFNKSEVQLLKDALESSSGVELGKRSIPVGVRFVDLTTKVEHPQCIKIHEEGENLQLSKTHKAKHDGYMVADTLSEMVVTQFFNTMLNSLDQDLNKEMYNYFLAEGIASNDGKSGLREHFKASFLRQLQTDSKRGTEVDGYAISTYTKMQEITGGKDA